MIALGNSVFLNAVHALADCPDEENNELKDCKCPANPDGHIDDVHQFQAFINFVLDGLDVDLGLSISALIDD